MISNFLILLDVFQHNYDVETQKIPTCLTK